MYVFESRPDVDSKHRTKVTFEIPDHKKDIEDLLVEFRAFLLACGFEVPGEIVVQKDDELPPQHEA